MKTKRYIPLFLFICFVITLLSCNDPGDLLVDEIMIDDETFNINNGCQLDEVNLTQWYWTIGGGYQCNKSDISCIYQNDRLMSRIESFDGEQITYNYIYDNHLLDSIDIIWTDERFIYYKFFYDQEENLVNIVYANQMSPNEDFDTIHHYEFVYDNPDIEIVRSLNFDSYREFYKSPITNNIDSAKQYNSSGFLTRNFHYEYDDMNNIYLDYNRVDPFSWDNLIRNSPNNLTRFVAFSPGGDSLIIDYDYLYNAEGYPNRIINSYNSFELNDTTIIEYNYCEF